MLGNAAWELNTLRNTVLLSLLKYYIIQRIVDMSKSLKGRVEEYAKIDNPTVAVGLSSPNNEVMESLQRSREHADLRVVAPNSIELPNWNFQVVYADNPEKEVARMLAEDEVDGIVRGTIEGVETYDAYSNMTGESYTVVPSVMKDPSERQFFVTPISNLKGWDRRSRYENALNTAKFIEEWGLTPKVAVFSGVRGRITEKERLGRKISDLLNKNHEGTEWIVDKLKEEGYDAKNWSIDLNLAIEEGANLIIPANGMVGNQIFRTVLFCGGKSFGGPRLGLSRYYGDNSRTEKDFEPHIKFLAARINKGIVG